MSKLIKRQDVIELIQKSYYDLANSEDDMWAMVADVEKLPVIETEGNGLKVIRCKDCEHYQGLAECEIIGTCMGTNGYCAWGKRK